MVEAERDSALCLEQQPAALWKIQYSMTVWTMLSGGVGVKRRGGISKADASNARCSEEENCRVAGDACGGLNVYHQTPNF